MMIVVYLVLTFKDFVFVYALLVLLSIPEMTLFCALQGAAGDWCRAECGEEMGCWLPHVPRRVS